MHDLRRRYDVSINTVGMALALLEQEGLVVRRNGRGVFVSGRAAGRRVAILSELDLFDTRNSPYWRALVSAVKTALEAAGHAPCSTSAMPSPARAQRTSRPAHVSGRTRRPAGSTAR